MWQEVRTELHPQGFEIVTVALDAGGRDAAGPWLEAASPEHPSLIDQAHLMDELFGVVNVPSGIWIDEEGMIVRPPEPAFPGRSVVRGLLNVDLPEGIDPYLLETLREARKIRVEAERYLAALRDWVANGAGSRFALRPDEVVRRSRPRRPRSRSRPLTSSWAATCTRGGTPATPSATSARPIVSSPTTGPTSDRPGRSSIISSAPRRNTRATG